MSTTDTINGDMESLIPTGKKIRILDIGKGEFREFEIHPFVLRNRIKFVKIVSEIFSKLGSGMTADIQKNPVSSIPLLIESAGEKLTDVYMLVLEANREWCEDNIQIKDEVEILAAIIEVNDIPFIVRRIQEALPKAIKKP